MTDSDDLSRRLLRGEASRQETAAALRDALLSSDPLPEAGAATALPAAEYAQALDAAFGKAPAFAAAQRQEEARAADLLDALVALPASERPAAVQADRRYRSWALAEALGEASFAASLDHPERAVELARLSVAVAEAAAAAGAGAGAKTPPHLAADLLALAYGQLANARRIASYQPAAERDLTVAFEHLRRGSGDPLVRARLLSFAASLRSDQSRFDDAASLTERAARLQHRFGDAHGYGRMLVKLANFRAYQDELSTACDLLEEARTHLDVEAEPRLVFAVHHNRASYLDRLGRHREAAVELAAAEPLAEAPLDRVRWLWLSGRVTAHLGDATAGEERLRQARRELVKREMGFDVACISLDLALLYAEQGRNADMKRLAEEMLPLFTSRQVEPEARAALKLYCDAARAETAGRALVEEVAERLRHLGRTSS